MVVPSSSAAFRLPLWRFAGSPFLNCARSIMFAISANTPFCRFGQHTVFRFAVSANAPFRKL